MVQNLKWTTAHLSRRLGAGLGARHSDKARRRAGGARGTQTRRRRHGRAGTGSWARRERRAPPPGPLRWGVVPLTGYPPSSQGFLSPPWARTWDHELKYPFEVVPTTNWATSSVGSGNYLEWVSKLMVPGSSPRR